MMPGAHSARKISKIGVICENGIHKKLYGYFFFCRVTQKPEILVTLQISLRAAFFVRICLRCCLNVVACAEATWRYGTILEVLAYL
jgi:hypothetical protein